MKTRFVTLFTNLLVVLFTSVSPIVTLADSGPTDKDEFPSPTPISHSPMPAACQVVYPTKQKAQQSCPPEAKVIEWYDFWQGTRLGWACDCSELAF